ncbi:MAG TPA: DUF5996 family protein, partial [Paralcaligenes sp.]
IKSLAWPPLPVAAWSDTRDTLHMWLQIVGKTRLALAPMENHWWQVVFYITSRGLSTSPMPYGQRAFTVDFDFIDHVLLISASDGGTHQFPLGPYSVADFYAKYQAALRLLDFNIAIMPSPVEVVTAIPFEKDHQHASYDPDAVHRFWRILSQTDRVLKQFRGRFLGKSSPVHFFWGSLDIAMTRFSGRSAPVHPGGAPNCPDYVMVEAYSRECASCGFWPGGGAFAEPAFYAYAYPQPAGYADWPANPGGARYSNEAQEFILPYDVIRQLPEPDEALLEFFQSTYDSAAELGQWDRATLDRPKAQWFTRPAATR